jgi:GT2 family glycosyltransferase/cytochrome c-type biogenesis protein CcmH/NrfG
MDLSSVFEKAATLAGQGKTEDALSAFTEIARRWPKVALVHANRAVLLRRLGQNVESVSAFDTAARLDPGDPERWSALAGAAHESGSIVTAVSALRRQILLTPDNPHAVYNLGVALPMLGLRHEAERELLKRVTIDPGVADVWVRVARAKFRTGRSNADLFAAFQKACVLDPANFEALAGLGVRFGGLSYLSRWHARAPDTIEASELLAKALIDAHDYDRLRDLLDRRLKDISKTDNADELIRLVRGVSPPIAPHLKTSYERWIERHDTVDSDAWRNTIAGWAKPPTISILLPVCDPPPEVLRETLASVTGQIYPHWTLCIADDASTNPEVHAAIDALAEADERVKVIRRPRRGHISAATNSALKLAEGPFVAFLDHDDLLAPHALAAMAEALVQNPELDLLYSDEDKLDETGTRFGPHFKPGWDPDRIVRQNYVCHFAVHRTELVRKLGGLRVGLEGAQDHDLVLRMSEVVPAERIRHIPRILYHWRAIEGSTATGLAAKPYAARAGDRAASDHLMRTGKGARVWSDRHGRRVIYHLPETPPRVTAIIPTRDRVELLRQTVDGLLHRTDYPDLEVIIVDNGSIAPETERYLSDLSADPRIVVLTHPGPFNFSEMMNRAAADRPVDDMHTITGQDVLLFLNNDVEPIRDPTWLRELVSHASRNDVGAVGALLLYPNRTIQHAGVVLAGDWVARHVESGEEDSEPGYLSRRRITQTVSAVTGACLAIRREIFDAVGGFDQDELAIDYSDIDLCLKAGAAGYRCVFAPLAKLIHHESATRGPFMSPEKRPLWEAESAVMRKRWGTLLYNDPYYNPNLAIGPKARAFTPKLDDE